QRLQPAAQRVHQAIARRLIRKRAVDPVVQNIIDNIDERLVEGTAIAGDMAGHAGKVPSKFYSQIWRKLLPAIDSSAARFNRHELQLVRPRVIRGRPDNLAV